MMKIKNKTIIRLIGFISEAYKRMRDIFITDSVSLFLFMLVFLIVPLLVTIFLYGSIFKKQEIDIIDKDKEYRLYPEISTEFTKYLVGRLFQTSLGLEWYDVCLENNNKIFINGEELTEDERALDPEGGAMEITISELETNASSTLYAKIGIRACNPINVGSNPVIKFEQLISRRPEVFPVKMIVDTSATTTTKEDIKGTIDLNDSRAYIKNNFSAWMLKYFAIITVWSIIIFSIKKLLRFFRPNITD